MITYIRGNLFESPARVLVNTVNTEGVMGKGIAKVFKSIYPDMFKKYQALCETGQIDIGKLWLYKTPNKWILNFPTKRTWRKPSKVEYIEKGLVTFQKEYLNKEIASIAFPLLGCGNGELDWEGQIRPLMERYLSGLPIDILIYLSDLPRKQPEHKNIKKMMEWLRNEPESLAFDEVWLDLRSIVGRDGTLLYDDAYNQQIYYRILEEGGQTVLLITSDDQDYFVPKEEILRVWNALRVQGILSRAHLSPLIENVYQEIIVLLSALEYCRKIKISSDYDSLDRVSSYGLQIEPANMPEKILKPLPPKVYLSAS